MQTDAVEQLRFIRGHGLRQIGHGGGIWVCLIDCSSHIRHRLQYRHALQHRSHFFKRRSGRNPVVAQCICGFNHRPAIALGQGCNQSKDIAAVHAAQHLAHSIFLQLTTAKRNGLIRQRQRIAHRATRTTRQQLESLRLCRNGFFGQHLCQVLKHGFRSHRPQIELQATRKHCNRHFLRIGRSQHKFEVLRRLFQRLQHGIECRVGQHVHLVDHEDLETPLHRLVHSLLEQTLHFIHTAVRGRIQFNVVGKATAINFSTCRANTARRSGNSALAIGTGTVHRFSKNTRYRGLAYTTCAGEQIRMVQTLLRERIAQGLHNVLLPHHFGEVAGTVFTSEHEIRHRGEFYGLWALHPWHRHVYLRVSLLRDTNPPIIEPDSPPRMGKRPTGSGGEPSSPNCETSAEVRVVNCSL